MRLVTHRASLELGLAPLDGRSKVPFVHPESDSQLCYDVIEDRQDHVDLGRVERLLLA